MDVAKTISLRSSFLFAFCILSFSFLTGCVYKFADVSIPPEIKTVRIQYFENRAPYVNPQLSPTLSDRLRQRVVSQTRLNQTNSDSAHYDIVGVITNYSVSTSGISSNNNNQRQASMNSLTIAVHITVNNNLQGKVEEYDVSRSFPFDASLSLQAAEARLLDEIIRNLTDDIFNRIFSAW